MCELQPGRFRKSQRLGGCRRPRCWLCHHDKLAGIPTLRDRRASATEREGIAEAATEKQFSYLLARRTMIVVESEKLLTRVPR